MKKAKIKKIVNKVFGTMSNNIFWKYRHLWDRNWVVGYISKESLEHPHRKLLIEKIGKFDSLLEVGCGAGANLKLLNEKYPDAKLYGMDISPRAIKEVRKWRKENVSVKVGHELWRLKSKSVDIVLTDAVLIYTSPKDIKETLEELLRIARKKVVLCEQHGDDVYDGNWIHDYKRIFNELGVDAQFTKITNWVGNWNKYGYIIEYDHSN